MILSPILAVTLESSIWFDFGGDFCVMGVWLYCESLLIFSTVSKLSKPNLVLRALTLLSVLLLACVVVLRMPISPVYHWTWNGTAPVFYPATELDPSFEVEFLAASLDGGEFLLRTSQGELMIQGWKLKQTAPFSASFSKGLRFALHSNLAVSLRADNKIEIWPSGRVISDVADDGLPWASVFVSPYVICAISEGGELGAWRSGGKPLLKMPDVSVPIVDLAVTRQDVFALHKDGGITAWDLRLGSPLDVPLPRRPIAALGRRSDDIIAVLDDGSVKRWSRRGDWMPLTGSENLVDIVEMKMSSRLFMAKKGDGSWVSSYQASAELIETIGKYGEIDQLEISNNWVFVRFKDGQWDCFRSGSGMAHAPKTIPKHAFVNIVEGRLKMFDLQGRLIDAVSGELPPLSSPPDTAPRASAVAAGRNHFYVLDEDGGFESYGSRASFFPPRLEEGIELRKIVAVLDQAIGITKENRLVRLGKNRYVRPNRRSQLESVRDVALGGFGGVVIHFDGSLTPLSWTDRKVPDDLGSVRTVLAGWSGRVAFTEDGQTVAWDEQQKKPVPAPTNLNDVVGGAGNAHHVFAIRKNGSVAKIGFRGGGELQEIEGLSNVVKVCCSYGTGLVLALTADGTLYEVDRFNEVRRCNVGSVRDICAGQKFFVILEKNGRLHTVGREFSPLTRPPSEQGFSLIAHGKDHLLGLADNGHLYAWGREVRPRWSNDSPYFRVPDDLGELRCIAAGDQVNVVGVRGGGLRAWGIPDSPVIQALPKDQSEFDQVALGGNHGLALKKNGQVIGWGIVGDEDVPQDMASVTQIACGREFCLALTASGNVFVWTKGRQMMIPKERFSSPVIEVHASSSDCVVLLQDGQALRWMNRLEDPILVSIPTPKRQPVASVVTSPFSSTMMFVYLVETLSVFDKIREFVTDGAR